MYEAKPREIVSNEIVCTKGVELKKQVEEL